MSRAEQAYFGWRPARHAPDCQRPVWEVDDRIEYDAWRSRGDGVDHRCPDDDCNHGNEYTGLTVRVVCHSCGVARVYSGELGAIGGTTTANLGYGQPPRKTAGLWLYPGPPFADGEAEPDDYLCTLSRVERVEPENVVGYIGQGRGRKGALIWGAAALPETDDTTPGRRRRSLQYSVRSGDLSFRTVTGAAKWVRAQVLAAADAGAGDG